MLDTILTQFTLYSQLLVIIFGTIGSLLNLLLFSCQKSLRLSSCSLYFRALSMNDLIALYIIVFPVWLEAKLNIDLMQYHDWSCKLKNYLINIFYTISPYFLVLACFDRLCTSSSNAKIRRIATIRVASYVIPITIILVLLMHFHIPINYKLITVGSKTYCETINAGYSRFVSLFLLFFLCIFPPSLMIIFCLTTVILRRQHQRRIMPTNQNRSGQRENQILKMLFIYVALNVICTLPFAICHVLMMFEDRLYDRHHVKLLRLLRLLLNINFSTSFYAYTLATPFYRQELRCLIQKIVNRICLQKKTAAVTRANA